MKEGGEENGYNIQLANGHGHVGGDRPASKLKGNPTITNRIPSLGRLS